MTSENVAEHKAGESAAAVSAKAVDDQLIDELVGRAQAEGLQLTGEGGLLQQLTKRLLESALEGEITDHLGYDKHDPAGKDGGNSRNGKRSKTVLTEVGPVEIAVPRDRDGSFEPKIVKKRQKRLTGVDEMVISLAAKGLTTGEVQAHLAEVYGAEVSRQTISTITDKVLEGMAEWQSRPLRRRLHSGPTSMAMVQVLCHRTVTVADSRRTTGGIPQVTSVWSNAVGKFGRP
ncbi:hypothetical protein SGLAM104S_04059 [Streptomyces glaucescens]